MSREGGPGAGGGGGGGGENAQHTYSKPTNGYYSSVEVAATDARAAAIEFFGFPGFRHIQENIILRSLLGHDTLALMPTGGKFVGCLSPLATPITHF